MTLVRMIARPMLSTIFIIGGVNTLRNVDGAAERAKPVIDKLQPLLSSAGGSLPIEMDAKNIVRANSVIHVLGGLMLATGRWPRLASLVLFGTLLPTTLGGHRYWEESDPAQRGGQLMHFAKNASVAGGLLLASVDTEGKPSLAWRARRQARLARKKASALTPGG
jgi:uncharacterized membrane protein YphA (DoxX/SURF4 family)